MRAQQLSPCPDRMDLILQGIKREAQGQHPGVQPSLRPIMQEVSLMVIGTGLSRPPQSLLDLGQRLPKQFAGLAW